VFDTVISALGTLPVHVLATCGRDIEPSSFGPIPGSVRIVQYVPQLQVLKYCNLVVSHAGAGTMLGALASGVPMLLLPQGADQLFNASRCCAAGAALMLRPDEASPNAIAAAAQRLMAEPSFASRAAAIAGEIASMPSAEDALLAIEQMVNTQTQSC
ncbi:nucleotide disphospho-sugar-binding domain-containing protein, partial [Nostoc sp. NIES-2111]